MNILVIASHPDDEIIGCGGTIAKYIKNGDSVYVCIVGEGSTGRFEGKYYLTPEERVTEISKEIKYREDAAIKAAKLLGVKDVYLMNFPNLQLDILPKVKVNKMIEDYIYKIKPDIIFTHSVHDINIDHVSVYDSSIVAGRGIKEIYTYEIIGSTTLDFKPNLYVDISDTFDVKKNALEYYSKEIREYPNPRSLDGIEILAKYRGIYANMKMAESFEIIRKSG